MKIYTDGSCRINPGPGGYGVVVMNNEENKVIYSYSNQENNTTNNIQELKALIHAFVFANSFPNEQFEIFADSAYAIGVFTEWAKNWEKNDWTKSDKKPIKNLELIIKGYQIFKEMSNGSIKKIKGHAENIGNELADALAANNKEKYQKYLNKLT